MVLKMKWYVQNGDHHIGPFSTEKMIEFYEDQKLTEDHIVWREGASEWAELCLWPEFEGIVIPPIPEPVDDSLNSKLSIKTDVEKKDHLETVSETEELSEVSRSHFKPDKTLDEVDSFKKLLMNKKSEKTRDRKFKFYISKRDQYKIVIGLNILLVAGYLLFLIRPFVEPKPDDEIFVGLSSSNYQSIKSFYQSSDAEKHGFEAKFAVGRMSDHFWLATHKSHQDYYLRLQMSPVKEFNLAPPDLDVKLTSRAVMSRGIAFFDEIVLESGRSFYSGLYDVKIFIHKASQELPSDEAQSSYYHGQIFFGTIEKESLIERLTERKRSEYEDIFQMIGFWQQGVQSLKRGAERLKNSALETLSGDQTGVSLDDFKDQYARHVAPVVQSFVVELTQERERSIFNLKEVESLVGSQRFSWDRLNGVSREALALSANWTTYLEDSTQAERVARERVESLIREEYSEVMRKLDLVEQELIDINQKLNDFIRVEEKDFMTINALVLHEN